MLQCVNFMYRKLEFCGLFQDEDSIPLFYNLSDMVIRGQDIPVQLGPLKQLESLMAEVQAWKESAAKTFLMKNSHFTLLEVMF